MRHGQLIDVVQCAVGSVLLVVGLASCRDLAGTQPLPAGLSDPNIAQNAAGAVQTAVGAEAAFQVALAGFVPISGVLTDEFQAADRDEAVDVTGALESYDQGVVTDDARQLNQASDWTSTSEGNTFASSDSLYADLQRVRAWTLQASEGLATYAPDSVILRGRMYALMGYAEVMLADLYCSGVPLSTMDFQANFTYQPGSTTTQVYQHAIAVFDTAITLAANNSSIVNLAMVGRGRAFLALGDYASAGQAVSMVPASFLFSDSILACGFATGCSNGQTVNSTLKDARLNLSTDYSVSDREGGTGLPFVSGLDPRTAVTATWEGATGVYMNYQPAKYALDGVSTLILASGLEAQLITAEADLNAGNASGMFAILNTLRQGNPATSSLPILTDPGTFGAEIDTLFTERAAWLFADGHRQGDLRRLMRNYVKGQNVQVVANQYPSGDYGFGVGLYGPFIDAPIPAAELTNPHFTGCLSRD